MSNIVLTQSPTSFNLFIYPLSDSSVAQSIYPTSPSTHFDKVDEDKLSPNDDDDYVYTVSPTIQSDVWNMQNHTTETGTINYIQVFTRARANICVQSPSGTFQQRISGTGVGSATSTNYAPMSTTYKQLSTIWSTKPAGGAWTWTDIDNLLTGINVSSPQVTGMTAQYTARPTADSSYNPLSNFLVKYGTGGDGVNRYTYVNEETPDEDDGYLGHTVDQGSLRADAYFTFPLPDAATQAMTASIQNVTIFTRAKYIVGGKVGICQQWVYLPGDSPVDKDGDTDYYLTTSYNNYSNIFTTRPGGTAWTWAGVDAAAFGLRMGAIGGTCNEARVTQFYIVVNYTTLAFNPEIRTTQQYVMVNYTPSPLTATLLAPNEVRLRNTRRTERFIFPDGTYCIGDYGRAGKTLSFTGTENANAIAKMRAVESMLSNQTSVTISGLLDVNQDTQWRLTDFNFEYDIGGDHYKYNADFIAYDYVEGAP